MGSSRQKASALAARSVEQAAINAQILRKREIDRCVDMWQSGMSKAETAKALGISPALVSKKMKKSGIVCDREEWMKRNTKAIHARLVWTPEMTAALVAARTEGKSYRECEKIIGVSFPTIQAKAVELGLNARRKKGN